MAASQVSGGCGILRQRSTMVLIGLPITAATLPMTRAPSQVCVTPCSTSRFCKMPISGSRSIKTCAPPKTMKLKCRPPKALKARPGPRWMGVKGMVVWP